MTCIVIPCGAVRSLSGIKENYASMARQRERIRGIRLRATAYDVNAILPETRRLIVRPVEMATANPGEGVSSGRE